MSSYHRQTISSSPDAEGRRLDAQADLFWEAEQEVLELAGARDGLRMLEVGCSRGCYAEKLLRRYPASSLVAIDADASAVDEARARLDGSPFADRATVLHQPVEELVDVSQFELALARLVLEHVDQPRLALERIWGALAPGGLFVCISNDFGWHTLHSPDVAGLPTLFNAYRRARQDQGGNPAIGRDLPALLQDAGFVDVALRAVVAHSDLSGLDAFRRAEGTGIAMQLVAEGYLRADDLAEIMSAAPRTERCVRMLLVASGRRPQ
jgi:SAM-dependent methyltransferase